MFHRKFRAGAAHVFGTTLRANMARYTAPGQAPDAALDDFEPAWFSHLPDPVYRYVHPAKCCWCLCHIPTGAAVLAVLTLLSGAASISMGATAPSSGADYVRSIEEDQESIQKYMRQQHQQQEPAGGGRSLAAAAWQWVATSPRQPAKPDNPFAPPPTASGDDIVDALADFGFNLSDPAVVKRLHEQGDYMAAMGVVQIVQGVVWLVIAGTAAASLFCGAPPLTLRYAAEAWMGMAVVQALVQFTAGILAPSYMNVGVFFAGLKALLGALVTLHYAGVVYQAARLKHFGGGNQHTSAGAEAVPPPPSSATGRSAQGLEMGPVPPAPPGVRVHTSGVGASGV